MIHPNTELRFVSPAIGYGVFATRPIPMGTITWVSDPLDQIISTRKRAALPEICDAQIERYSYINGRGERILCWDHGRYMNHSCDPSCISPGFDFEIAIRDIRIGEELSCDYGTLNIEEEFRCLCGSKRCRGIVRPDDMDRQSSFWDACVTEAFPFLQHLEQPLWPLVHEKAEIRRILSGERILPSCRAHYLGSRTKESVRGQPVLAD